MSCSAPNAVWAKGEIAGEVFGPMVLLPKWFPGSRPARRLDAEYPVRVFVSSTFKDMQRERDILVRRVFPRIRETLATRGMPLYEVDLRWGVTQEEAENLGAIDICLDEIDACRPFFLCLLGERYGWCPNNIGEHSERIARLLSSSAETASLTELEIRYATLKPPSGLASALPVFLFRAAQLTKELGENEEQADRVALLKRAIRAAHCGHVWEYHSLESFEQLAEEEIRRVVTAQLDRGSAGRGTGAYGDVPRERELRAIERKTGCRKPLILTGNPGAGVTWLCRQWLSRADRASTLYMDGRAAKSFDMSAVARERIAGLSGTQGLSDLLQPDEAIQFDFSQMSKASGGRFRIVLDHVDHATTSEHTADVSWLPDKIPGNVRLIVVTRNERILEMSRARGWRILRVPDIDGREKRLLSKRYLAHFGKNLSNSQFERLVGSRPAQSLGGFLLCLDELRRYGVFETLDEKLGQLADIQSETALAEEVLSGLKHAQPVDVPNAVEDALFAMSLSLRGLEEAVLCEVVGSGDKPLTPLAWATLRIGLGRAITARSGRVDLASGPVRAVALGRVASDPQRARDIARRMEAALTRQGSVRAGEETTHLLLQSGDLHRLADFLGTSRSGLRFACSAPIYVRECLEHLDEEKRARIFAGWLQAMETDRELALETAGTLARLAAGFSAQSAEALWRFDAGDSSLSRDVARAWMLSGQARRAALGALAAAGVPGDAVPVEARWFLTAAVAGAAAEGLIELSNDAREIWSEAAGRAARATGSPSAIAQTELIRTQFLLVDGKLREALKACGRAIQAARRCGHARRLATALCRESLIGLKLGRFSMARRSGREALAISDRLSDGRTAWAALGCLAAVERRRANWEQAYNIAREMIDRAGTDPARLSEARAVLAEIEAASI